MDCIFYSAKRNNQESWIQEKYHWKIKMKLLLDNSGNIPTDLGFGSMEMYLIIHKFTGFYVCLYTLVKDILTLICSKNKLKTIKGIF